MHRTHVLSHLVAPALFLAVALGALAPASTLAQQEPPAPTPATPSVPTVIPTPTPRPAGTPPRVGLQVGHWKSNELPDELSRLRTSTGAYVRGLAEVDVNLDIARRVAALLTAQGIVVDLIPATVPPSYDADAFVAIHADGSSSSRARGFKLATPWRTSRASQHLLEALSAEYAAATRLPRDGGITVNMRGYYAFNYRRHTHAIARTTPAVILETGFLTNPADRALLTGQPDIVAAGIANGILRYLRERDPSDGAALIPPEFGSYRAASPTVAVRAAPSDTARVLLQATPESRFFVFRERDGWFEVMVRGNRTVTGWVRVSDLVASNEPPPAPPPSSDS
ncbi:MAG: N-acetylmuramoyl-L-alanine amidase [Chloroflexota bacterium]|nr:MAG: cell wall hydrolase [Chloroflexota bacterium]